MHEHILSQWNLTLILIIIMMIIILYDRSNQNSYILFFLLLCSLEGRFEEEELQQILDDIQTKRSFQY